MSITARLWIATVSVAGAALLVHGLSLWSPHDLPRFFVYLLLAIPVSCLKVRLPGVTGTLSVTFLFALAGIVELGLPETLIMGVVCGVVQSYWHARNRPRFIQLAFNIGDIAIATTAAYYAYLLVPATLLRMPLRLAIASSAYFLFNSGAIAVVLSLTEKKPIRQVWRECYSWSYPYYVVGGGMLGVFILSVGTLDWQVCILLLPIIYVIYRSYRFYVDGVEGERHRAEEERQHAREMAALNAKTISALAEAVAANAKLDAVVRASPLATLVLDHDRRITSWNATAERIFGWTVQEAIGSRPPFATGQSEEVLNNIIDRTLRGEVIAGLEAAQDRKDGVSFTAAIWTAQLQDRSGSATAILMMVADVSDRKQLEEHLRLSHKMEAVGRLAGGIAHDFNNLLTVINGYGGMLASELKDDAYAYNYAEEIVAAGKRAAELVSQLLTFSRKRVIQPKPIEVNQLVRDMERMLQRVITEHIELSTHLDPDTGWIMADANQMEAVLLNLSTNARDAMPNGGILAITTERIEIPAADESGLAPGPYVRIAVKDTGLGMDAKTKQHLFEPFFTTKAMGKGTGLGLPSVYGGVHQNHGHIVVESELGQGSTFSIYLPRMERPNLVESPRETARKGVQGSETVLLVEDESAVRRMLFEALTRAGYRVWEAANGGDAIRKFGDRSAEVDLLITDVVMPVINGLRLAEEFRNRRPDLRVIFVSGHAEDVINEQGCSATEMDLLQKPFPPDVLVQKVRKVLDRARNRENQGSA